MPQQIPQGNDRAQFIRPSSEIPGRFSKPFQYKLVRQVAPFLQIDRIPASTESLQKARSRPSPID
jgi:hypothetical protein